MEREKKEEPVCTPKILLFRVFLHISIIYAKYLAYNLGSGTEMIINTTLVSDFQYLKLQKLPSPVNQISTTET